MFELNNVEIGIRIKNKREALKYTRSQTAEMIGVSEKTIQLIENGSRGMSIEVLAPLSKILMISVDYILFGGSKNVQSQETILGIAQAIPEDKEKYLMDLLHAAAALARDSKD